MGGTFQLACGGDARTLGIEAEDGSWALEAFERHVATCERCGPVQAAVTTAVRAALAGAASPTSEPPRRGAQGGRRFPFLEGLAARCEALGAKAFAAGEAGLTREEPGAAGVLYAACCCYQAAAEIRAEILRLLAPEPPA